MWSVVAGALSARRGQAGLLALIALLACAAAASAGWYAAAATPAVAVATAQGAPFEQRLVTAARAGPPTAPDDDPAAPFGSLSVEVVSGGHVPAELFAAHEEAAGHAVTLAHRDDVCAHLTVTGDCPAAPGEVVVPDGLAATLGLITGAPAAIAAAAAVPEAVPVRVVGTYRVSDPFHPYWGDRQLAGVGEGRMPPEVVFARPETVGEDSRRAGVSTHDLIIDPGVFATIDSGTLAAMAHAAVAELSRQGYVVTTQLPTLLDRVDAERRHVTAGVATGLGLLLLLTVLTLTLVVGAAADRARRDTAWWQLRGAPARYRWTATLASSVVPLLAGAVVGTAVGVVAGRALAGGSVAVGSPVVAGTGWRVTAVLVGATVAAAVLAAVAAQAGTLRAPVRELLRRVPGRRRWGGMRTDAVVVVLVVAAVAQAILAGAGASGIALLAPGLAGLGLALAAGWTLSPLAARLARRALRAGRLAAALAALSIARRRGMRRLFALIAAAVALLVVALVGADTAARDQWQRATVEAGAAQVLTVAPIAPGELLAAVRAADPDGRAAMAVVRTPARGADPPVLAVDATRLSTVAGWRDGYGGDVAAVAGTLRPAGPGPVALRTTRLAVEAAGTEPGGLPLHLRVLLRAVGTGEPVGTVIGPLPAEPGVHTAAVPGCAAGCELVGFELLGAAHGGGYGAAVPGSRLDLHRVSDATRSGPDAELLGPDLLGDPSRWRPAVGQAEQGPVIAARDGRLRLTSAEVTQPTPDGPLLRRDYRVYLVDAPVPLPAVTTGWGPPPEMLAEPRLSVLGGPPVPVRPAGARLLPALGPRGALVDLEYAHRSDPSGGADGVAQVWLAPEAGAAVVGRLRDFGLAPVRREALDAHAARLGGDGATTGLRFQVAVAVVTLLLAGGALLARFAGPGPDGTAELAALRAQGLDARVGRMVGYGVPAALVASALPVGIVAGLAGVALHRGQRVGFVDGWALLPPPPPHPYPVVVAALVAAAVLGAAAMGAARPRRSRGGAM